MHSRSVTNGRAVKGEVLFRFERLADEVHPERNVEDDKARRQHDSGGLVYFLTGRGFGVVGDPLVFLLLPAVDGVDEDELQQGQEDGRHAHREPDVQGSGVRHPHVGPARGHEERGHAENGGHSQGRPGGYGLPGQEKREPGDDDD